MMRRLSVLVGVVVLMVSVAVPASAVQTKNFRAHLSGGEEVHSVDTQGQGQVKLRVDGNQVQFKLIVANTERVTQAHIHCGAAGSNGPVAVFLFGFVSGGVTSNGVLAEGSFSGSDLLPTCGFADIGDLVAAMVAGNTYVNVHTVANPAGEIRGQIH
jgi:hypothetical protein